MNCLKTWGEHVSAGDMDAVVGMYLDGAVLLPTVSDEMRTTPERIQAYFEIFLPKVHGPVDWKDTEVTPIAGSNAFMTGGHYVFPLKDPNSGEIVPTRARFSMLVAPDAFGTLKILHHHSSASPE